MSQREDWGAFGVTVAYGRKLALDEVTLEVPAGQVAAVVGGDGAGKTTLLRCLTGAVRPRSGRIVAPSRKEIGFMPAATGVWRDLTVAQNMEFVASAHRIRGKEFRQRRDLLLEAAGLAHLLNRQAGHLSGGMLHKLAFSCAMLHRPRMLVLDEPSTGVDPVSRIDLWRLISQTAVEGTAVALATTYLDEAERCATVLVLDDGRALQSGTPDQVINGVPGTITVVRRPPDPALAWRRGRIFHAWHPGPVRPGEEQVSPDMEDAVVAAALHARVAGSGNGSAPESGHDEEAHQ
ncbi:hypothetical protein GCM10022254_04250 [Actinomadura meridiana]|uniref:ABC transporter domain-containing protein n=1 Tax=Actinomadura meridiana TaxID=559626 RepID=A0ABP8BS83_9ACTN